MSGFIRDIYAAKLGPEVEKEIETSRGVIDYYNPANMRKGFEDAGYFIYDGVKVFERGVPRKAILV